MKISLNCGPFLPYLLTFVPFLFGLVISLAGNKDAIMKSFFDEKVEDGRIDLYWTIAMSMFPTGGTLGSIFSLVAPKTLSRKLILISANVLGLCGSILYLLAYFLKTYACFVLSRLVHGTAVGILMSFGIVTYLQMVIPKQAGFASTLVQPIINFGIVLSSTMNLNAIIGDKWLISIAPLVVSQALTIIWMIILPESPVFSMQVSGDILNVGGQLRKIRPRNWDCEKEAHDIHKERLLC
ncbi:Solute carrier family 2, facilitated glucose transporter member 7 [Thelohanellus kitauei]|uniref:Solute carrier family 2, facilitated glucose transporter member 7 n=1 Tax=Thelohanellus kitauei TaxID=669202 RepID=A0A0C2MZ87_THEKT|nr:Solute carrier family 2, facilitated glucose transporter member 7 [Thelohanellus kitauei]